jgi:hypothetical protein
MLELFTTAPLQSARNVSWDEVASNHYHLHPVYLESLLLLLTKFNAVEVRQTATGLAIYAVPDHERTSTSSS